MLNNAKDTKIYYAGWSERGRIVIFFFVFSYLWTVCNLTFSLFFVYCRCPCPNHYHFSAGLLLPGLSPFHVHPSNIQSSHRGRDILSKGRTIICLLSHCSTVFRIKPFAMTGKADLSWPGHRPMACCLLLPKRIALSLPRRFPVPGECFPRHLCLSGYCSPFRSVWGAPS